MKIVYLAPDSRYSASGRGQRAANDRALHAIMDLACERIAAGRAKGRRRVYAIIMERTTGEMHLDGPKAPTSKHLPAAGVTTIHNACLAVIDNECPEPALKKDKVRAAHAIAMASLLGMGGATGAGA